MPTATSSIITHADVQEFATSHINIKREDVAEYRAQVNRLRDKLADFVRDHPDTGLIKMLLAGSLAKGTALKNVHDVDVALYVRASEAPSFEPDLLEWLAERLRKAYPQMAASQIQPKTHCVCISFHGTGLDVDVAPVHYDGLPDDRGYLYALDTGQRVLTSIPLHLQFIRSRKGARPSDYAQVIRLIKWWVTQRKKEDPEFRCKSFLVEMLCAHLKDQGLDFQDYPDALERFFVYIVRSGLKERIFFEDYYKASALPAASGAAMEVFDPVNPDNNVVGQYVEADRKRLIEAASSSLDRLAEARYAQTKERAATCWRQVLGPSFLR